MRACVILIPILGSNQLSLVNKRSYATKSDNKGKISNLRNNNVQNNNVVNKTPSVGLFKSFYLKTKDGLNNSQTVPMYKAFCKTCVTLRTNIKNLVWSLMVLLKLDKLFTPRVLFVISLIRPMLKWGFRGFALFNLIVLSWLLWFNTPVITLKLLAGLFKDFFTVSFKTYTDTIARFFDYIIKGLDEGFKNVPGSRIEPLRYPNEGFVKEYKKLLEMIKDLPPRSEVPVGTSRWYDFLRDLDSDTVKKLVPTDPAKDNNSIIANNIKFIKDNWQYLAGVTVFMIGSIVKICYWTDITNVFSSIKSGIQSFIGYFSGGGGGGGGEPYGRGCLA